MNRSWMRTFVAIAVIAAMVLLAVGAVGSLLGGPPENSAGARADATGVHARTVGS